MKTVKLGDVCVFKPAKSSVKSRLGDDAIVSFSPMEQLPIAQKYFIPEQTKRLDEVYSNYVYFEENDVIYAKITPCFENGKMSIAKNLKNGVGFGSSEFVPIRCSDQILPEYLYYFLLKPSFIEHGSQNMRGASGHKRVPDDFTKELRIALPDIEEQRRVVERLDAAFEKIDRATELTEKNLAGSQLLFKKYLQDKMANPNWRTEKLPELAAYFNGLTYRPSDVNDSGTIVLRSSNIQNDELEFSDVVRVNCVIKDKLYVESGDILMCSRNGSKRLIGKTAVIDGLAEQMTFGTFMMIIKSELNPYLIWFFKSNLFRSQLSKGEATQINQITRYILDDISVPLPPEKDIALVADDLRRTFLNSRRLQMSYRKKLQYLAALKQSLLTQAFTQGEVE